MFGSIVLGMREIDFFSSINSSRKKLRKVGKIWRENRGTRLNNNLEVMVVSQSITHYLTNKATTQFRSSLPVTYFSRKFGILTSLKSQLKFCTHKWRESQCLLSRKNIGSDKTPKKKQKIHRIYQSMKTITNNEFLK